MRFEIYAKRLAEKTNTPILEDILLGKATYRDLPDHCMVWTGTRTHQRVQYFRRRHIDDSPLFIHEGDTYARIRFNGKQTLVHRLLFELLFKPQGKYRMRKAEHCSTPLCVNPTHWDIRLKHVPEVEIPEYDPGDEWTDEVVLEMVEAILGSDPAPTCWEDIINDEDMDGAPEDVVRQTLIDLNKEHLTWPSE